MTALSYVVFAWEPSSPIERQTVDGFAANLSRADPPWQRVMDSAGVAVYCAGASTHTVRELRTHDSVGVVLGRLFSAVDACARPADIDAAQAQRILASAGRELIAQFWGNYVAVMHHAPTATLRVLRGPMSSLPCLHVSHNGLRIFFSHVEDCLALGLSSFEIDWEYIELHLSALLPTKRTGLRGVAQLLPGQLFEARAGHARESSCWDPLEIAARPWNHDEDFARTKLRAATRACVHAWAGGNETIALHLSGGLDSSIVLACLKDAPGAPRVVCVNDYSPGVNGDERMYARLMAQQAGIRDLIEERRDSSISLEPMLQARPSPVPQNVYRRVDVAASESRVSRQFGVTALFAGSGGDDLFFQSSSLALADFIHTRGVTGDTLRLAYEVAQVEGISIWAALARGLRMGLGASNYDIRAQLLQGESLVTPQVAAQVRSLDLSDECWLSRSFAQSPPGRARQVVALSLLPDYYDPIGRPGDPELIRPLLSQPLVEAIMQIPPFVLLAGGWERGLARQAFAEELPPQIAWRRGKGSMGDHMLGLLRANRSFVSELLLDGVLVDRGFIDRQRLAAALADRTPGLLSRHSSVVLHYLNVEAWLRSWQREHARR